MNRAFGTPVSYAIDIRPKYYFHVKNEQGRLRIPDVKNILSYLILYISCLNTISLLKEEAQVHNLTFTYAVSLKIYQEKIFIFQLIKVSY